MATITNPSGTSFDIGNVESIDRTQSQNIITLPAYSVQEAWNQLGVEKSTMINGVYTGTTTECQVFIDFIRAITDGIDLNPSLFNSDETDRGGIGFYFYVKSFRWSWSGVPSNNVTYTLELVEDES